MNEADTRRELIDPKIKEAGWGDVEGSYIRAEFQITNGEIKPGGIRAGIIKADYVLIYKNRKLAVIEAKKDELDSSSFTSQDLVKLAVKKGNLITGQEPQRIFTFYTKRLKDEGYFSKV